MITAEFSRLQSFTNSMFVFVDDDDDDDHNAKYPVHISNTHLGVTCCLAIAANNRENIPKPNEYLR
ncbi:hypothetical protein DERP_002872 [Dermatophagoides pteronyssinus]|uniref:Uncharacterized protein n=1 Tax=Dermatophagoides pteronyssinus TaxID=6956 RepID=A0ABQ8JW40_DERPT|nr:hypothetical protein DERP_002872 [Dermatophagoides pteronyssinus]